METNLKLNHVPHWLATIIGFTYISGYLIDFFYFTSRGVSDVGGDLFKLRYIHVGIYFDLTLALCVATPIFVWLHFFPPSSTKSSSSTIKGVNQLQYNNSMVWVAPIYQFSLFVPTILSPNDFFSRPEHPWRFFAILGLISSVLVIYIGGQIYLRFHPHKKRRVALVTARAMIVSMIICDLPTITGLFPTFSAMFPNVVFYILFCILLSAVITLGFVQISETNRTANSRAKDNALANASLHEHEMDLVLIRQVYLYGISSILILFLILTTYAYVVYPFIPVDKGGGDFSYSARVSVLSSSDAPQTDLNDAVLIYSTSESLFFAKPEPGNDACNWRTTAVIPNLVEFQRREIRAISHGVSQANCF